MTMKLFFGWPEKLRTSVGGWRVTCSTSRGLVIISEVTMNWGKIIAILNIILCLCACAGYLYVRDYRRAAYWFGAAVITTAMTV